MSDLASQLRQFTGSETWYRHSLMRDVVYTEGVQYLAEKAGAYWLIDKIAILQLQPKIRAEDFQSWKLKVNTEKSAATLVCEDGNGKAVFSEEITFTDFPLSEITVWYINNTILLPSEY